MVIDFLVKRKDIHPSYILPESTSKYATLCCAREFHSRRYVIPKLRGHHLICLQFFHGEGYSEEFVDNLRMTRELLRDEAVGIAAGPDDVCRKCPHLKDDACGYNEHAEQEIREMDQRALRLLAAAPGGSATWDEIREKLPMIFHKWHASYCMICDWRGACEKDDFYRQLKNACLTEPG